MDALKRSVEEPKAQKSGTSRRAKKDRLKPGMRSAARDHDVVIDRPLRRSFALIWQVFSAFLPFFVLWLSDRGLSPSQIGVVLAAGAMAAVIAAPFWSHVADRRAGTVRTLQVALSSAGILAIALDLTGSVLWAIAAAAAALAAAQSLEHR